MPEEKELAGMKEEMEKLADHFEENGEQLGGTVDSDSVVGILRSLLQGARADTIIEGYGFEVD